MKLDDINDLIEEDSQINIAELDKESVRIPSLVSKWTRTFIEEAKLLRELEIKWKIALRDRTEYYLGKSTDEVYQNDPLDSKIIRQDLQLYLDSDDLLIKLEARRHQQKLKCDAIEQFIKNLNQRSFNIANAIKFIMFKNGING